MKKVILFLFSLNIICSDMKPVASDYKSVLGKRSKSEQPIKKRLMLKILCPDCNTLVNPKYIFNHDSCENLLSKVDSRCKSCQELIFRRDASAMSYHICKDHPKLLMSVVNSCKKHTRPLKDQASESTSLSPVLRCLAIGETQETSKPIDPFLSELEDFAASVCGDNIELCSSLITNEAAIIANSKP